jgi:hypothetical protein
MKHRSKNYPEHDDTSDKTKVAREKKRWPPMGRNPGRQWGDSAAAYGEISMAAVNRGLVHGFASPSPLGDASPHALIASPPASRHATLGRHHRLAILTVASASITTIMQVIARTIQGAKSQGTLRSD